MRRSASSSTIKIRDIELQKAEGRKQKAARKAVLTAYCLLLSAFCFSGLARGFLQFLKIAFERVEFLARLAEFTFGGELLILGEVVSRAVDQLLRGCRRSLLRLGWLWALGRFRLLRFGLLAGFALLTVGFLFGGRCL